MTPELAALAATALVHVAAVMWSQRSLQDDVGKEGNVGPRDNLESKLSDHTKRLRRALGNHIENIGLFIIAVVLVSFTESNSVFTALCAWLFVIARALYLPAYAFGWVPWRSVIFTAGFLATFAMIIASFF
ncbi:MAPEG family protein [Celeribacter sp. HF31]|uniref:MAPEG family protein n=1 Tax=Celeribacter sp. HF31 TaxID=2721558 RepID=UPI00142FA804|nr:MAPEG family protein [Celeribacter sp. HF31]NIY80484.1 MAPEG family protein [Celeribacter sp. HF31]